MSGKQQSSFLDSKSIMAILLVGVSWFFWDGYMKNKYPHLYKQKTNVSEVSKENINTPEVINKTLTNVDKTLEQVNNTSPENEEFISFKSDNLSFDISTFGMGIKNIYLNKYFNRENGIKQLNSEVSIPPFSSRVIGENKNLIFTIKKLSETRYEGTADYQGTTITKILDINPENYSVKMKIISENIKPNYKGVKLFLTSKIDKDSESSMLMPTLGGQELFVKYENTSDRILGAELGEKKLNVKNASVVNLGETYFSLAMINKSNILPTFSNYSSGEDIIAQLSFPILNRDNDRQELFITGFVGPKDVNVLKSIDQGLLEVIDYGWFDAIARVLLRLLKFLNSFIGNWGFSIVFMTLLVKLILLPLNIVSFRSMKRMQKIQPKIKEIRAKHKENPQEMNLKVMKLMKEQKANPLSGCLPMLFQFPIFFALYRVLGQSIELYQAPFILWIHDLSLKDPFYILPVLMGIAMFFQMKISPSTMDPTQKKIMMFMPVMFSLFMLALPSGLTLYIFISTLFGIIQHFILMREPKEKAVLLGPKVV